MEITLNEKERNMINAAAEKIEINFFSKKGKVRCYQKSCKADAINSHAISREISLRGISVDGNLKYFESKRNGKESKTLLLKPIGIYEATTFKGFCLDHDSQFKDIDNLEYKYSQLDIILQCYRSVCYAYYISSILEVTSQENGYFLKDYFSKQNFKDKFLNEFIKENYSGLSKESLIEINSEDFEKDFYNILNEIIERQLENFNFEWDIFKQLKSSFETILSSIEFCNELKTKPIMNDTIDINNICMLYKRIGLKIPVAMVNHHPLIIDGKKTILLFTVIPYASGTEIYWIFNSDYKTVLNQKWLNMNQNDIGIINRIESSMINSEQWFIDPRVIDSIPNDRMEIIKQDLYFNNERSLFVDYDLSIFDELRLYSIKDLDEATRYKEKQKITSNVNRESFDVRFEKYKNDVYKMY